MVKAVKNQGVKTGITGQNLPGIPGCRVTVKYAIYVFTDSDGFFLILITTTQLKLLCNNRCNNNVLQRRKDTEENNYFLPRRTQKAQIFKNDKCFSLRTLRSSRQKYLFSTSLLLKSLPCYTKFTSMLYPENLRMFSTPLSRIKYWPLIPIRVP